MQNKTLRDALLSIIERMKNSKILFKPVYDQNKETFDKLLEIYNVNIDKFDINFDFTSSGICKIVKKSESLIKSKIINTRTLSLKNFIRKTIRFFKKI